MTITKQTNICISDSKSDLLSSVFLLKSKTDRFPFTFENNIIDWDCEKLWMQSANKKKRKGKSKTKYRRKKTEKFPSDYKLKLWASFVGKIRRKADLYQITEQKENLFVLRWLSRLDGLRTVFFSCAWSLQRAHGVFLPCLIWFDV